MIDTAMLESGSETNYQAERSQSTSTDALLMKHLEFIQAVINRMARNSFQLKAWSLTLAAALLALAANNTDHALAVIAIVPGVTFWGLDAYYLRLEKLYRALYDDVRETSSVVPRFSMDTSPYESEVKSWPKMLYSTSISLFHGVLILVIVAAIVVLAI